MRPFVRILAGISFLLAGYPLAGSAAGADEAPAPLVLDVTGWQRSAAPLPGAGDGIGPGSYLLITIGNAGDHNGTYICTANFVWTGGAATYLGAAGHCFLPPDETKSVGSNRWVEKVEVCTSSCAFGGQLGSVLNGTFADLGPVVYARQKADALDPNGFEDQIGHDFGLVTIPSGLLGSVRPEMPVWGGPTGVNDDRGGSVCMYGSGFLTGETFATKARTGVRVVELVEDEGWEAQIAINGGDSGSAINMCDTGPEGLEGTDALGIVTHGIGVGVVPTAYAMGTTVAEAKKMVLDDLKESIDVVLAGTPGTPVDPPTDPDNVSPTASFASACTKSTCTFDGGASSDPDGSITSYRWNFGDGTAGEGKVVSHSFGGSRDSTYDVTLTIEDDDGATGTATDTVTCTGKGNKRRCIT